MMISKEVYSLLVDSAFKAGEIYDKEIVSLTQKSTKGKK